MLEAERPHAVRHRPDTPSRQLAATIARDQEQGTGYQHCHRCIPQGISFVHISLLVVYLTIDPRVAACGLTLGYRALAPTELLKELCF
jgi:hypothetical protein